MHPWDDGKITANEFKELLKNAEQKTTFFPEIGGLRENQHFY